MKDVTLPSGATLRITLAPFGAAKDLYQALLRELKGIQFTDDTNVGSLMFNLFCTGFSSAHIEHYLWICLKRCTYASPGTDPERALKIDADTFEPEERREDWLSVCTEVTKANIFPFAKRLYALYVQYTAEAEAASSRKSTSGTTTSS